MKKIFICLFMFICFPICLQAVVLSTEKNGVVDIEKVFENFNRTQERREDSANKKDQYKKSLIYKQKKLSILIDQYNILVSSINYLNKEAGKEEIIPLIDKESDFSFLITPTKAVEITQKTEEEIKMAKEIEDLEKKALNLETIDNMLKEKDNILEQIEKAKNDFFEYKDKTRIDIEKLEQQYLYDLLDEIYLKVSFIAQKYGYNVLFDKKDLVFSEKYYDLTDLIILEINKDSNI
jgi:Skp family chaperone for outer membrane proteins